VYLTDAYPLYFAVNCEHPNDDIAVIQLATDRLNPLWLVPDEDVLEQVGRGKDGIEGSMKKRTKHYRNQMVDHLCTDNWKVSLEAMGTCASLEPIPASAITRVAFLNPRECQQLTFAAIDAMICLPNYRFCGPKYRNMTNRLFGLPTEPDDLSNYHQLLEQARESGNKDAITVLEPIVRQREEYEKALAADYAKVRIEEINA
jgi:hypothetical protein